jgi:hypothetical protein
MLRRSAPILRHVSQRLPFFHPRWNEAYGWRAAAALATLSAGLFAFAYLAEGYVTDDPLVRWDARFIAGSTVRHGNPSCVSSRL